MSPNPSPLELLRPVCLISALQVIARYLHHQLSASPVHSARLAERVGLPARNVDAALRAGVAYGVVTFENGYKATEAMYELNLSELDTVFTYAVAALQTVKDICTKEEAGFILGHGLVDPILRGPTPGIQQSRLMNLSDGVAIAAMFALVPGQSRKEACEFLIGRGFDSAGDNSHETYSQDKPWTDVLRMFLIDAAPPILSIANHLNADKGPSCPLLVNARGDTVFEVVDRIRLNKGLSSLSKIFPIGSNVIVDVARHYHQIPTHLIDVGGGDGSIARQWNVEDLRVVVQDKTIGRKHPRVDSLSFEKVDFFDKQPHVGAAIYHIRFCLHNWGEREVRQILGRISDAMDRDSTLLLVETVVPTSPHSTDAEYIMDHIMLGCTAQGKERTVEEWEELLSQASLTIVRLERFHVRVSAKYGFGMIVAKKECTPMNERRW